METQEPDNKKEHRQNITDAWLKSKKVKEGRETYHDTSLKGFGVRISFTGTKTWQVLYRVAGDTTKRRMDLGRYPVVGVADARAKASAALAMAEKGIDPAGKVRKPKDAPTFKELAADYLAHHAKLKKRSADEDERILNKELLPRWKNRKAQEVKKRDVVALLDEIAARPAPIMANRTLALIRKIYRWANSRDLVETNPCLGLEAPAPENQRDRVLNDAEIRALWLAFGKEQLAIATMFKVRLLTAQRGGEVESMAWSDLDLEDGWWTIPAEKAKNKLSHRVPLAAMAIALLKTLRADAEAQAQKKDGKVSPWVFPSRTKKGEHVANIQKAAQRVKATAEELLELEKDSLDFVMHDLRRTAASYMASAGVPRLVISKVLNHVESGVTKVYDRHSYDAEKRQAMEAWADRLGAIIF